jgi:hypothetical protein
MNSEELGQKSTDTQVLAINKSLNGVLNEENQQKDNTIDNDINKKTEIPEEVVLHIKDLYQRNLLWDEVLDQSKNNNLNLFEKSLAIDKNINESNVEKVVKNCDNELKHLLIKFKFINELYDGMIRKLQFNINSYQMKDFHKQ